MDKKRETAKVVLLLLLFHYSTYVVMLKEIDRLGYDIKHTY